MLARDGAFSNRPPVPWEPPPKPRPKRASKRPEKRSARAFRVNKPCPYCRRAMTYRVPGLEPTRDHVIPKSKGGTKIIVACWTCNNVKGDMLPDVWERFMMENPEWWIGRARYVVRGFSEQETNDALAHIYRGREYLLRP